MAKTPMDIYARMFPDNVKINPDKKWWHFWKETYVFKEKQSRLNT
jgi:hypothetical protein